MRSGLPKTRIGIFDSDRKHSMKRSPVIVKRSSMLMLHDEQDPRRPLHHGPYSRLLSCSTTINLKRGNDMTAATNIRLPSEVVLKTLLAHDFMAFTQFAFGVVRPGIHINPIGISRLSHTSCPRSPKALFDGSSSRCPHAR